LFLIEDEDKVPEDFNLLIYYQNTTDKSIEYVIVIYWVNLWEELRVCLLEYFYNKFFCKACQKFNV
jgi:hypothetical protein